MPAPERRFDIAQIPGSARHFTLRDASTLEIEKVRIEANFASPKGALELEKIKSDEELAQYHESLRCKNVFAVTVRVPRIRAGNVFWPPSRRALERIRDLLAEGEEISFAKVEGTDLSKAWEGFTVSRPP